MGLPLPIQMHLVPVDVGLHLRFNFLNKYSHPRAQSLCSNVRSDEYYIQKIKQISDSMKAVLNKYRQH